MLREYIKLKRFVRIPWRFFAVGLVFMVLAGFTNGLSLSTIVPLMDRVLVQKPIMLPESFPSALKERLEGIITFLNNVAPLVLLRSLIFFLIVVILMKGVLFFTQNYLFRYFGFRVLTDLKNRIYERLMQLSMDFFSRHKQGELTTRIIYDVDVLSYSLYEGLPLFLFKSFETAVYLTMLFLIDWKLSFVSLFVYPLVLLPVFRIGRKLRKLSGSVQETYGRIGNIIQESIYGQQVIKAFNREKKFIRRFMHENESLFKTVMALTRRTMALNPFTEIMATIGGSGIIYYGATRVLSGEIGAGFLLLFLATLFALISPLKSVGTAYANLKQASAALPRIYSVLEHGITVKDAGQLEFPESFQEIRYKNVGFSYNTQMVLKNVNFSVRRGEKIGIVGATGSGKTTLINLLLRFYDPTSGEILVDGKDIRSFTLSSLRDKIGLVTQEPILFHDTISRNISLDEEGDIKKVYEAAEQAGVASFIESLPEKYETVVGERGTRLSGGQKQLICVARAIYKNPPILVLDEATASLDSSSEKVLQEALNRVMEGRTVFIIAHRLSTVRGVDRIIVLENGTVAEEGTHVQLMEKKGIYHSLWMLQFPDGA